jgi:CYTH domain-containing protein/8-oxo-dGTP pyrophosphatase MutT (NUDIX family)
MNEIERKFLLNYVPQRVETGAGTPIRQAYLWTSDEQEARIRQQGKRYSFTMKAGSGLTREETEISLTRKQFDALWPQTEDLRVEKTRHRVTWHGRTVEVDIFGGPLEGLRLAEVEFEDEEQAAAFDPPPWCGKEVTGDPLFLNRTLADMDEQSITDELATVLGPNDRSIGAIPIAYLDDSPSYVLVTTTGSKRWIFPKGMPEEDMSDAEVARMEAWEEAGVEGRIVGEPFPVYYWKGYQCSEIDYYPLQVDKLHMDWDESKQRDRKVCGLEEALELLDEPSFRHTLTRVARRT